MAESKARVYDDLMCRHWDRWDEGEYRHIFIAELTSGGIGKGVDIIGEGCGGGHSAGHPISICPKSRGLRTAPDSHTPANR